MPRKGAAGIEFAIKTKQRHAFYVMQYNKLLPIEGASTEDTLRFRDGDPCRMNSYSY